MNHKIIEIGEEHHLTIPGEPYPCPRPKINRSTGRAFYPGGYLLHKKNGELLLQNQWKKPPIYCGIIVEILFLHRLPKSKFRKKTADKRIPKICGKGDIDNFVKSIFDVLQGGQVIANDSKVFQFKAVAWYASQSEPSRTEIIIKEIIAAEWTV